MSLPFQGASAAIPGQAGLSFLVVGDWGMPRRREEASQVAAAMGIAAERIGARFVVSTGDNFYEAGVSETEDPLWQIAFEDVYTAPSLMCPWYAVLGNHDYKGNVDAQIAYSGYSTRWRMPARYYRREELLDGGGTADFFFLDTQSIHGHSWTDRWFWRRPDVQRQIGWLEEGLASSRADWKLVIGHHPVHSGGQHGDTREMIDLVEPLLERYGVQAYINGHDHDLQHIVVGDVSYITSGAGAETRPTAVVEGSRFASSSLGFVAASITSTTMTVDMIDQNGEIIYQCLITA